jgi:hypothetical protein
MERRRGLKVDASLPPRHERILAEFRSEAI